MKTFRAIKESMKRCLLYIKGIFVADINLEHNAKKLIDRKATKMNRYSDCCLIEVSEYIKQLNLYIDEQLSLSNSEIESKLDHLVGYYTITLEHPIDAGLKLLRAVKYQEDINTDYPCYDNISRLSYISKNSEIIPNIGRLNKKGESIYYGCIYFDDRFGGYDVAFSEVNALERDRINILKSEVKKEIKLNFIGFMDYIFRESKPYFINDDTYEYYKKLYEYMQTKFDNSLFTAFLLCDTFFADILNRIGSRKLYNVTSVLASIFLDGSRSDGLLYTSVQAKSSPVIALKPIAVDKKVQHISVECFNIVKSYGYAKYHAIKTHIGSISRDAISWKKVDL